MLNQLALSLTQFTYAIDILSEETDDLTDIEIKYRLTCFKIKNVMVLGDTSRTLEI